MMRITFINSASAEAMMLKMVCVRLRVRHVPESTLLRCYLQSGFVYRATPAILMYHLYRFISLLFVLNCTEYKLLLRYEMKKVRFPTVSDVNWSVRQSVVARLYHNFMRNSRFF